MKRRQILTLLTGAGTAALLPNMAKAEGPATSQGGMARSLIGVDMHSHVPPDATLASFPIRPQLDQSGLTAICASFPVDAVPRQSEGDWYRAYLAWATNLRSLIQDAGVRQILSLDDLNSCHRDRVPGVLQSAEGAQFLEGKLERLEEAYRNGLRHLQIAHSVQDPVAPLGDLQTLTPQFDGLTRFGHDVIEECNRLGIVVDLAHSSGKTLKDAIAVSRAPLVVSHTALLSPIGLGSVPSWPDTRLPMRLLRPDEARMVAAAGGVIGVWHIFPTLRAYAAAILDLVREIGADHVGIGSDTGIAGAVYPANWRWPDQHNGFLPALTSELRDQGCSAGDVMKIAGENYCRVLQHVEQSTRKN